MKRVGNLIEQIADPENLRLAFWKARKGKDGRQEVEQYRKNMDKNMATMHSQILEGSVPVANYYHFTVCEPKQREIYTAPFSQRVLHHAVMNICHPYFERFQIFDSYATRIGKGQYAALERAKEFSKKYTWFAKLDVRKYFDSINHEVLFSKLATQFKDPFLMNLFRRIIDSYETSPGKGIPIGNLTSQYFANFYLAFADHFIKEKLKATAYVRYMDDMVLWSNDKHELVCIVKQYNQYITNELKLELKPLCLNQVDKGLPFLGYTLFKNKVRLNKTSKRRFTNKLKLYHHYLQTGRWAESEFANHCTPLFAFVSYAHSFGYRKALLQKMETG